MVDATHDYVNTRRMHCKESGALFVPVCEKCGRFVKADNEIYVNDREKTNASCSKCGRTKMLFEGYM